MKGLVLAAGAGSRLRPHTQQLPKTLLPVNGDTTILDVILHNLAAVDVTDVTVVVGHAAHAVERRAEALAARHGVSLTLLPNIHPEWNNAYSLWSARHLFAEGALLVNGDTVHPVEVEKRLLAGRGPGVLLAVDAVRTLTDEAMKVVVADGGRVRTITKQIAPSAAHGEYIGVAVIEPSIADGLTAALEATWRADPNRYYEDAFQVLADDGADVCAAPVGAIEWVEVDDDVDLARAREIACRY